MIRKNRSPSTDLNICLSLSPRGYGVLTKRFNSHTGAPTIREPNDCRTSPSSSFYFSSRISRAPRVLDFNDFFIFIILTHETNDDNNKCPWRRLWHERNSREILVPSSRGFYFVERRLIFRIGFFLFFFSFVVPLTHSIYPTNDDI